MWYIAHLLAQVDASTSIKTVGNTRRTHTLHLNLQQASPTQNEARLFGKSILDIKKYFNLE